jgi:uncharacterized protein (TIGR03118 family)
MSASGTYNTGWNTPYLSAATGAPQCVPTSFDPYYNPTAGIPCSPQNLSGGPGCGPCGPSFGGPGVPRGYSGFGAYNNYAGPYTQTANGAPRPVITRGRRMVMTTWKNNPLVSNRPNQAAHDDADLIDPWGIILFNEKLWVNAAGTDFILNYDTFGNKLLGSITIRDADNISSYPTGIAANCNSNFTVTNGTTTKSSQFVIVTEHGTIQAYSPHVDTLNTFFILNTQVSGRVVVYKGVAIANNRMYLADFFNRRIDVMDDNFVLLDNYTFVDNGPDPIPSDYGPFNIVLIGCFLYVLWAKMDRNVRIANVDGVGNGYISVFDLNGTFIRRFVSRGALNSPWGMVPAPAEPGIPPNSFLVGNQGDGRINIYDSNGAFVSPMMGQDGTPVIIPNVRGLAASYGDINEIYYTSSIERTIDGLVGVLTRDQVVDLSAFRRFP